MTREYIDIYDNYLKTFEEKFGNTDVGQPVRNDGYLVKKLAYDDFIKKWTECKNLETFLRETMSNGYTLNDTVEYEYKELCASVMENAKDFKTV
ncbi:MAG: hypothetical protein JXR91_08845 [Deltaproteobacteria bacterium]|nr:hypothetical protein [Deltaproteobacteria bacterium]